MKYADKLEKLIYENSLRMDILRAVNYITTYDLWIGAGFIRNLVWDNMHGIDIHHDSDIDILWFDKSVDQDEDIKIENKLNSIIHRFKAQNI